MDRVLGVSLENMKVVPYRCSQGICIWAHSFVVRDFNQVVHSSVVDKLVPTADSGWPLLEITNVNAYGCTMAYGDDHVTFGFTPGSMRLPDGATLINVYL